MGWRPTILPIASSWVGLGLAALAARWLPAPWAWLTLGALALAAAALIARGAHRRRARQAAWVEQARRMMTAEAGPETEAAPSRPAPPAPLEAGADVGRWLDELDARVRRQARDLAKNSRNLLALIDGLDMPVIATGEGEGVLLCNPAAESLLGVGTGQLQGRNLRELFTRREVLDLHAAARAGHIRRAQVMLTTPQGPRTFQVSATPLPAAWGEGVFGTILVLRDVTELAQAVAVKTDFVANASHELRTPVSAIKTAIETMQEGARDDAPMRARLLDVCANHVQRLEDMLRDLMDLSRLESPDLPVHIAAVPLDELAEAMRLTFEGICAQRRLRLEFDLAPAARGLRSDSKLLSLILRNLIDNATKYAREGTAVTIQARRLPAGAQVEGGPVEPGVLRLEVRDRGIGIPLAQQERVFERFYQVDPARTGFSSKRGTGLGLAIVKHAAKALGGRAGLESVWGEGTSVWVEVPAEFGAALVDGNGGADASGPQHPQGAGANFHL